MDIFMEKIVTRKKTIADKLIVFGVIMAIIILTPIVFMIPVVGSMGLLVVAGMIYGGYYVITSRNIEYEFIVTNGDLDIDRIVAQRKRKRIFSASCKGFDIVAKVKSSHFTHNIMNTNKKIEAVSSMDGDGVYFIALNYKGEKTVVFFEPNEKMLNSFKKFISRKMFV